MGKKYIIELLDDCQSEFKGILTFGVTQEKQISVELIPKEDLTPYTEPDLEQVRKEAYDSGYDDAKGGYENGFENGMIVAWDAARKIQEMDIDTLHEIFGWVAGKKDVFIEYTASEAIEKIRQYEQEQDRQARIEYNFDEIKDVLETTAKECNVSLDEIAAVLEKMRGETND